jgi:hypothetical protein
MPHPEVGYLAGAAARMRLAMARASSHMWTLLV